MNKQRLCVTLITLVLAAPAVLAADNGGGVELSAAQLDAVTAGGVWIATSTGGAASGFGFVSAGAAAGVQGNVGTGLGLAVVVGQDGAAAFSSADGGPLSQSGTVTVTGGNRYARWAGSGSLVAALALPLPTP
ncbi:MAG: hypothetical protein ACFCVA_15455 [Gammaproteobacteria bacterium]